MGLSVNITRVHEQRACAHTFTRTQDPTHTRTHACAHSRAHAPTPTRSTPHPTHSSNKEARVRKMNRSRMMLGSTPGRCTLMATSSPVSLNTALYTCRQAHVHT